jgi:hypothetical protein
MAFSSVERAMLSDKSSEHPSTFGVKIGAL